MAVACRPNVARESAKARAVAEWRKGKKNTLAIARQTGLEQHEVCAAIAADQDARHRASTGASR